MIYQEIDSPFTDGKATLCKDYNTLSFRKSDFKIIEHYYICQDTKEQFTIPELDKVNLNQVYNQYRDKHGLPFPDQIKMIREKYDISAKKMSEILGLGINTYRLYEQGDVPSVGNGRLIMAANDPQEFFKFLSMSQEVIGDKEYEKLSKRLNKMIEENSKNQFSIKNREKLFNKIVPDHETGYRLPDLEKISHMIMFFSRESNTWGTKLNKLLFYTDFLSFKNSGFGISGLDYRAIKFGPVPSKYGEIFKEIASGDLLEREYDESPGGYWGSYFIPKLTFNELLFDEFELEIMEKISTHFKYNSATEMKNISHQELAWLDNKEEKKIISYKDYGFSIQAI